MSKDSPLELVMMSRMNFENLLKTPGGMILRASPMWIIAMDQLKAAEKALSDAET